MLIINDSENL
jgi:hypothetical protein